MLTWLSRRERVLRALFFGEKADFHPVRAISLLRLRVAGDFKLTCPMFDALPAMEADTFPIRAARVEKKVRSLERILAIFIHCKPRVRGEDGDFRFFTITRHFLIEIRSGPVFETVSTAPGPQKNHSCQGARPQAAQAGAQMAE